MAQLSGWPPVWKSKFYGAFALNRRVDLHAIEATPARWRGDADSPPLDGASTAASSPRNHLVKNCRVHPTQWLISSQVTVWKQTQELDRRLNMLMIARAQRLAARAAKRVREIDLSGVPKFCRTLPRRFALKRFEDERLQILQRSTQRVAFLRQLAARAPKPAETAPAPVFKPRWKKPRKRPKTPEPEPAAPPARRATRLLSAVRWGRIQAVHAGTAPTRPPPPPPC